MIVLFINQLSISFEFKIIKTLVSFQQIFEKIDIRSIFISQCVVKTWIIVNWNIPVDWETSYVVDGQSCGEGQFDGGMSGASETYDNLNRRIPVEGETSGGNNDDGRISGEGQVGGETSGSSEINAILS